jgi:hypothetical protein
VNYSLRLTGTHYAQLRSHLFPGDGCEAVALLLCGRRAGENRHIFTVRKVVPIPYEVCDRRPDRVTWPTDFIDELLADALRTGAAIVKIHGHGGGYRQFSSTDDVSDRSVFSSVASLLGNQLPHGSLIMMDDGEIFGRVLGNDGEPLQPFDSIMAVGDDLNLWIATKEQNHAEFTRRHAQAFGNGTANLLRRLSAAVIGASGTGSIVIEQLARLGIGRLVNVDPDVVEEKNLNRILNTTMEHAVNGTPKVFALEEAIRRMGVGTEVKSIHGNLIDADTVRRVAECDVVFGCMDGVEGRHMLNRLATFYNLPYFDVGVRLDADGKGGIERIAGAVHYLQPGRSSLLSRGVYNLARLEAEEVHRTNPEMYRRQVKEGYLRGVEEDRPAVISVNMFFASLAVNEFIARIHLYRTRSNGDFAYLGGSLSELQFYPEPEAQCCDLLSRHVGRGDVEPLLERSALS